MGVVGGFERVLRVVLYLLLEDFAQFLERLLRLMEQQDVMGQLLLLLY